jgi:predicted anti-sigma-YlaC factor YlaD
MLHIAMCRHCRAFSKQLKHIRVLARLASERVQLPEKFEEALISRLIR